MVTRKIILSLAAAATLGVAAPAVTNVAQAFDMGNMMNPGRWFDDDDDRYWGRYGGYGYGPYGGYGGPYGWGGGPYGWGGGPYGWGGPYGGYGGYGQPSTIVVNPSSGQSKPAPKMPE